MFFLAEKATEAFVPAMRCCSSLSLSLSLRSVATLLESTFYRTLAARTPFTSFCTVFISHFLTDSCFFFPPLSLLTFSVSLMYFFFFDVAQTTVSKHGHPLLGNHVPDKISSKELQTNSLCAFDFFLFVVVAASFFLPRMLFFPCSTFPLTLAPANDQHALSHHSHK